MGVCLSLVWNIRTELIHTRCLLNNVVLYSGYILYWQEEWVWVETGQVKEVVMRGNKTAYIED